MFSPGLRDLAKAPYASKRHALAASAITPTRHLANTYDDWMPETLAARQVQIPDGAAGYCNVADFAIVLNSQ